MKGMKLTALLALISGTLPLAVSAQVVVLTSPAAQVEESSQSSATVVVPDTTAIAVLPPAVDSRHFFEQHPTTQERRGIGIGSQASAPLIAPQFNEPMIGQQGPSPFEPGGVAQTVRFLPVGVQPGLSDQGLIFPEPGTIVVGPQGTAVEINASGNVNVTTGFQSHRTDSRNNNNSTTTREHNSAMGQNNTATDQNNAAIGRTRALSTASGPRGAPVAHSGHGK